MTWYVFVMHLFKRLLYDHINRTIAFILFSFLLRYLFSALLHDKRIARETRGVQKRQQQESNNKKMNSRTENTYTLNWGRSQRLNTLRTTGSAKENGNIRFVLFIHFYLVFIFVVIRIKQRTIIESLTQ